MDALEALKEKARRAPEQPGCYLFRDAQGDVLYVGKAVNLRNRLRSYFQPSTWKQQPKVRRLLERAQDLDWIVVGSELEALILEINLIKRHRPRYNIQFRDDKRYPYIKVHWQDPFPKVTVTRRVEQDGARYYGPYPSAWAVHETLDTLRRIFPFLTCNRTITGKDPRACLYYDIGLCAGPCIGAISQEAYRRMIDDLCQVLEGRIEPVVERLEAEMRAAAERWEFERAARLRDQIRALRQIADSFEAKVGGVIENVTAASQQMQSSAQMMSETAERSSRQSTVVASASEKATANVNAVSAATEELSASIGEISRQVTQSSAIAQRAVNEAEQTNETINGLAQAANRIGEVISLISDIASQTNLLALNATIEAARAGEAGKGFAVVASEVKNLATQTARATEEITAQIAGMQGATGEAVSAIGNIGRTISEINEVVGSIASAVEEQGAATGEIASNVQLAAAGTAEVNTTIADVSQAANATGETAMQVLEAASGLSEQANTLRQEVDDFLKEVRSM